MGYRTVHELLDFTSSKYSTNTCLYIRRFLKTQKYSYNDVRILSNKVAAFLINRGHSKETKTLIWAPNMPEWSIVMFGVLRAGGVFVPVNTHASADVLDKYISQTSAKFIFLSKFLPTKVDLDNYEGLQVYYLEDFLDDVNEIDVLDVELPEVSGDDLAELVFTSGTTGDPKGVMLTHKNIVAEVDVLMGINFPNIEYRLLSILPLSHIMEQIVGLFVPMALGATIYYIPRINPLMIRKAMTKYSITFMAVVPQFLKMFLNGILIEVEKKGKTSLFLNMLSIAARLPIPVRRIMFRSVLSNFGGKLNAFFIGSAPLDVGIAEKWEAMGIKVIEGYGASETAAAVTANNFEVRRHGSVGKVLPGIDIKLSEEGEILIKGDVVTPGYFNAPEKNKITFTPDGYYRSGDIGHFDDEGYLYITGRISFRIINSSGDKIYPEDVEKRLNAHSDIHESCVVGVNQGQGEIVYASLILVDKPKEDLDKIIRDINMTLEPQERILGYSIWTEKDFPRQHTLKIDRKAVKATYEHAKNFYKSGDPEKSDTLLYILSNVCGFSTADITDEMLLVSNLQLDSLKRVELVAHIEMEYGIEIFEDEINPMTTVRDLRELINLPRKAVQPVKFPSWPRHPLVTKLRQAIRNILIDVLVDRYFDYKIINEHYLNEVERPAIFIFNHVGHWDGIVPILAMNEAQRFWSSAIGNDTDYNLPGMPLLAGLVANSYPINKEGGAVKESLDLVADLLEEGWHVIMAPEGRPTFDGQLLPFRKGIGILAVETGVQIVPIKIRGYYEMFDELYTKPLRLPDKRGNVTITVGEPLRFDKKTSYSVATKKLEKIIRNL